MFRQYLPKSTEELIHWYERFVAPFSLLAGFLIDNVIFRAIDLWTTTIAISLYLLCAIGGILALNFVETGRVTNAYVLRVAPFFPVVVQFAFGGIFSAFFVLYSESATLVSWISVIILAFLLVGNERFRRRYMRFSFQVSALFIALVGFLIFLLPLVFKRLGTDMFLASMLLSVALIALYLLAARRILPELVEANLARMVKSVAVISCVFSILYFTNAIPPLPLSLKDAGIYHHIERTGAEYTVRYEPVPWYRELVPFGKVFHRIPGEELYVFSAVFAPSGLSTTLTHEWQNYDSERKEWSTVARVTFPVNGGRDSGYRGFSLTTNPLDGKWRVNVLTRSGQTVGRISFTVVNVPSPVTLEEKTL